MPCDWNWAPNVNQILIRWNCNCAFDSNFITWNWVVKRIVKVNKSVSQFFLLLNINIRISGSYFACSFFYLFIFCSSAQYENVFKETIWYHVFVTVLTCLYYSTCASLLKWAFSHVCRWYTFIYSFYLSVTCISIPFSHLTILQHTHCWT